MLRITVCGEGPIARSVALMAAYRGHNVRVLAANPATWSRRLRGTLPDGRWIEGPLQMISASSVECVSGSDVILVCEVHSKVEEILKIIAPQLTGRMLVGGVPGFGGFGVKARKLLPSGTCIFGLQRIPFVVRTDSTVRSVRISGIRRQTYVAAMPAARSLVISSIVEKILAIRCVPVSHYINVELSPSNSLVNPARLYTLFGNAGRHVTEKEFFTDWSQASSETLLRLDVELQTGCQFIPRDTSFVAPILLQYDANDARTLTLRFRNLVTLSGRPVPIQLSNGRCEFVPHSSYVTEDIDHGLACVRSILRLAGSTTPLMDEILHWRKKICLTEGSTNTLPGDSVIESFSNIQALMTALD